MTQLDKKRIGNDLRKRRLQYGYTQESAAEMTGISLSYYVKIERGIQLPSLEICVALARTFHLSLDSWILNTSATSEGSSEKHELFQYIDELDASSLEEMQILLQKALLLKK